jgi:lipopolysaccharide/colanic/teichoic acid biosynthesis glycosyltransferase/glycosyltransferase involved in cell wall biosynthesis
VISQGRCSDSNDPALMPERHIALIVTVPVSTIFFRDQITRLREAGYRVTFICSPGPERAAVEEEGAEFIAIPMEREIAILKDLRSLWRLWRVLLEMRPDITNVGTPKAGLLGGIAAKMAGVPVRIYTIHGLRLEGAKGLKRAILGMMERISCGCGQYVRCVSPSLRDRVVKLRLVLPEKAYVVAAGSANGIDAEHFRSTPTRIEEGAGVRLRSGIPAYAPVIGFVGRFTRDKGIAELYGAFLRLKEKFPELRLLLLGRFEDGDPVDAAVRDGLEANPNVVFAGVVKDTPRYYAAMNVLALPTYREGFGNVCIEAQAASVPVVTTRVTGAADSVLDGVTGLLVPSRDEAALAGALAELLGNPGRTKHMGKVAAEWVHDRFRREIVWDALVEDYKRILTESGDQKSGDPVIGRSGDRKTARTGQAGFAGVLKVLFDRVMAAALLVGLSPVMAVVALLVRMKLGSPVLFRQKRPGKNGEIFELVKFRTMTDARDAEGRLLSDDVRLTGLGKMMRSLSLDELPQLWNVLRGELSLVGPRPLLVQYLERYTREQARRHEVKPGITGWAQVNGRNAIAWEEKFALDTWYVDHWSLWLDMKILAMTVWRVVRRSGVSAEGQATMEEFRGSGH